MSALPAQLERLVERAPFYAAVLTAGTATVAVVIQNVVTGTDCGGPPVQTHQRMFDVEQALITYAMYNQGQFPSSSDGLKAASEYFPDSEVPVDAWGNNFVYNSPGTHGNGKYEISSLGADGKDGGEGVNADIHSWDK